MKKCILVLFLSLLSACDDPCSTELAAGFLVNYRYNMHNDYIDWNLSYVAKKYVISVENTHLIDERYGTRICRAKIKNKNYETDMEVERMSGSKYRPKAASYVCFTYVPRLNAYVQEYGEGCCKGSIYLYVDDNLYSNYCWL